MKGGAAVKNKTTAILAALVLLFGGFTGGFFLGRNTRVGTIQTTKTVYETVPGETVILMQEVLVTLPPETTTVPEETIPSRSNPSTQTDKPKETQPKKEEVTFPVNINTASAKELDALPGIGEVLAQRIIDYRTANGPFQSVDDLIKVKGIGEKTLEKIKPYATV
jgi:comEA protein